MSTADLMSRALRGRSRKAIAATSAIAIAAAALVLIPGTSNAQIDGTREYETIYSDSIVGDVTFAANSLVLNAQTKVYADVDSDATTSNSSTANLDIPAGATVEGAWLHWMAKTKNAGDATDATPAEAAPANEAAAVAWILRPGDTAYQVLDATPEAIHLTKFTDPGTAATDDDINVWMASSDITHLISASGSYTVSVPFLNGTEAPEMAGWNMTVVYSLPAGTAGAKLRNITVVDGFKALATGAKVAFSSDADLQTAVGGKVTVGVAGLGGDAGLSDYLRVAAGASATTGSDITNALNPLPGTTNVSSDIFNGTISKNGVDVATRSPGYSPSATPGTTPGTGFTAYLTPSGDNYASPNDFGNDYSSAFDSDIFDVSSAFTTAPTQVSVEFGPSATLGGTGGKPNDTNYPAVATLAVDIAAPLIRTNVSMLDLDPANTGIGVGDKVQVTVTASNVGPEAGKASAVIITLPSGLIYAPESGVVGATSLNPGSKSDVVSSATSPVDGYSYNSGSRQITWNLGTAPSYTLAANAADGTQTLTFEAWVAEAVRTPLVAPTPEDFDPIITAVRSEAVSTLEADGSSPSVFNTAGYQRTMDNSGVAYVGTPRHDLNLTTANVALEATTANSGRLRFKALNAGPVNTLGTVKWEYDNTEFTPNVSSITGATCTTSSAGSTGTLSCAITAAVPSLGMSAEISVPLTFLKSRETLKPGKIWVIATGASSPDASDIDATNKYTTNTLYEKTAAGASTWPAIPQAAPFVVAADTYNVGHNTPLTVTAANGLLKNDTGAGLSIVSNTNAVMASDTVARGTLVVNADGSFTYTPVTDFKGTLTFTYSAKSTDYPKKADGVTDRVEVGTVTLIVADKTEAVADTYYTAKGVELVIAKEKGMFSNDLGTPFTLTTLTGSDTKSVTVAVDGSFTLTTPGGVIKGTKADGSFTYTPTATFLGKDVLTYAATDSFGGSKTGTLTIEVLDKPEIADDTLEATGGKLNFDPLKNDKGTGLKITAFDKTSKEGGTIVQEIDGTLTFTPKTGYFGTDSFTYTVTDAAGQSSVATVSIVIPEALAYTGDHVLAPVSGGLLLLITGMLFFVLSGRRMAPVARKQ